MPLPDRRDERERKLESLGFPLDRKLSAGAIYKPVVVDGTTVYVSGCVPFDGDGNLVSKGKVPSQVSLEDARKAAALCAANVLRLVRQEVGSLDRVERMLRVTGYVNSDADFTSQHLVINGASQLFVDVFGDAGWHARSAVGMAQLPLGASVEVEAILKLRAE
jgi:enamine deaminase RidA (YjgF/YER057c/UK114 family)